MFIAPCGSTVIFEATGNSTKPAKHLGLSEKRINLPSTLHKYLTLDMYGKNSGTGNAQLSPRSKIISLGLNQVEAPPLRFRPLVKAADFPFSDQAERNDQQQKYQSTNYDYDHEYEQDTGSKYEKDYPPSPEQLRSQYTEFQKQLIAEQMSGNYDHGHNDGRAKTLAKGLEYQGYLSAPSPAGVDKEKLLARYAEYQKKLVADETHLIEPTRQKFVRKIDEDYGPGLVIGKQTDKETDYRAKREAQAAYGRQLSNDIRSKPIAGTAECAFSMCTYSLAMLGTFLYILTGHLHVLYCRVSL